MKNFKQAALAAGFILTASINVASQAEKNNLILNVAYYNQNNHVQYLKATAKAKIDGKFQMVPGIKVTFYITDKTPAHLLGKAITDDKGNAILFMPPSAHDEWIKSAQQSFVVLSAADKLYDAAEGSADVTK
ncbi:MAG TPA: hypothetical protein VHB48_12355, partial [Chitinophagaceae bacterium]|nr:hypothetical protein [Chitinophagaceae bacterium]